MEVVASGFVNPFVGVGPEIVSLGLEKVLRESTISVTIVIR